MKEQIKQHATSPVYGMGFLGAAFYYISQATSFTMGLLGLETTVRTNAGFKLLTIASIASFCLRQIPSYHSASRVSALQFADEWLLKFAEGD